MTSNTAPARRRRIRLWSVAALALVTLASATALAFGASSSADSGSGRLAPDLGETGASPSPAVQTVDGKTKFRVATFNVLGYDHTAPGGTKRGYADGSQRMKWAVQLLKSNDVDLVGLQEFQPPQYDKWIKKASSVYDIWPGYVDTVGFLRNSIAWRRDKFSLVSSTWIKLPYFKGEVLRMPVVLLKSVQTGQQFYVMNFQNPADTRGNAEKWRLLGQRFQIAVANQLRASNNLPIIWTGDMNAREQVFCRVTSQAAMVSASGGYRDATSCQPPSGMVVDWIFGSGVRFKRYEQIRTRKVERTSDHHLLTTKVKILPTVPLFPTPPAAIVTCATTTPTPTPSALPSPSGSPSVTPTANPSTSPTPTTTPSPTPTVTCATITPAPVILTTAP